MCTTELGRGKGEDQGGDKEMSSISLLTNSALVYEPQCGRIEGLRDLSQ
jgi:hypothetical protein